MQIVVFVHKGQIVKSNIFAEDDFAVCAVGIADTIQSVSSVPDISIVAFAAVKDVVSFAADDDVAAVLTVDLITVAAAVNDVVVVGSLNSCVGEKLFQHEASGAEVFDRSVGKFQKTDGFSLTIILVKEVFDFDAFVFFVSDINVQIIVVADKMQIVRGYAFAETKCVGAFARFDDVQSVAFVPDVNVIAVAAVKRVVSSAAGEDVVTVVSSERVMPAAAGERVVAGGAVNVLRNALSAEIMFVAV